MLHLILHAMSLPRLHAHLLTTLPSLPSQQLPCISVHRGALEVMLAPHCHHATSPQGSTAVLLCGVSCPQGRDRSIQQRNCWEMDVCLLLPFQHIAHIQKRNSLKINSVSFTPSPPLSFFSSLPSALCPDVLCVTKK